MANLTTLRACFALLTVLALAACTSSSSSDADAAAADSAAADAAAADRTTPREDVVIDGEITKEDVRIPRVPIDFTSPQARACFAMATNRGCVDCCGALSNRGNALLNTLIAYECGCRRSAPCASECDQNMDCRMTQEWARQALAEPSCLGCLSNVANRTTGCAVAVREQCLLGTEPTVAGLETANCGGFMQCVQRCPYDMTPGWVRLADAPASCGPIMGSFTGSCERCEVEPTTCLLRCECSNDEGSAYITTSVPLMGCTGGIVNCSGVLRCGNCDALTPGWVRPANAPAACGNTMGTYTASCRRCEVEPTTCQLRCECGGGGTTTLSLMGCRGDIANCDGTLRCGGCG